MSIQNVKLKTVDFVAGGEKVSLFFSMGAASYLAVKYGSTAKAETAFFDACFKIEDDKMQAKNANELMTKEFFDIMRDYITAMLYKYPGNAAEFFDNCGADDLPALVQSVVSALGFGNPEPKENQGSANPQ